MMLIKKSINEWIFSNVPLHLLDETRIITKPKYKIKLVKGEFLYEDSTGTEYTLNEMNCDQAVQVVQSLHLFKQLMKRQ